MDTTIDFSNFSNHLLKDLVKSAFVKGMKFSLDNSFQLINGKLISRRNYGAKSDEDMCLGNISCGNRYTFDEIQNLDFDILSKEDFEWLSSRGTWSAVSNSSYSCSGFNRRALLEYEGKTIVFYGKYDPFKNFDDILIENGIDADEYKEYTFAYNWLSDNLPYDKALMVAIPMKFESTPETRFSPNSNLIILNQKHHIKNPLFLKVDKTYKLPCHIVINLEKTVIS